MNATHDVAGDVDAVIVDVFGDDAVLSRPELAARLGCCVDVLKEATANGLLTAVRLGLRRLVYSRAAVRRWLIAVEDAHAEGKAVAP